MKRLANSYKFDIDDIYKAIGLNEYLDDKVIVRYFQPYFFYATLETPEESGVDIETDIDLNDKEINEIKDILIDYLNNNQVDIDVKYTTNKELADKIINLYSPIEWYYDNEYHIEWEDNYIDNYDYEADRADYLYDQQF